MKMTANGSGGLDVYPAILNLLTAIAALAAVVLAVFSENRARKTAAANVRPMLTVNWYHSPDKIWIVLSNQGLGTAKSLHFTFTRAGRQSKRSVIDVFDETESDYTFDNVVRFRHEEEVHLRPSGEYALVSVSREHLEKQGIKPEDISKIFAEVNQQIRGLTIAVNCEDVLGNPQKEYHITF